MEDNKYCSFCGKGREDFNFIIASEEASICDLCIETCRDLLGQHRMAKLNEVKEE